MTDIHDLDVTLTGVLRVTLRDEHGAIKTDFETPNVVTTAGKSVIADRMKGTPAKAAMTHMAVGTNSTAAAAGDTALGAEVAGSRTALTSTGVVANVITYAATFGAGVGTGTLTEAGILNAGSAGDLLCRTVFSAINKQSTDSLTITWTVTVN
jgi:hypothetical protein